MAVSYLKHFTKSECHSNFVRLRWVYDHSFITHATDIIFRFSLWPRSAISSCRTAPLNIVCAILCDFVENEATRLWRSSQRWMATVQCVAHTLDIILISLHINLNRCEQQTTYIFFHLDRVIQPSARTEPNESRTHARTYTNTVNRSWQLSSDEIWLIRNVNFVVSLRWLLSFLVHLTFKRSLSSLPLSLSPSSHLL